MQLHTTFIFAHVVLLGLFSDIFVVHGRRLRGKKQQSGLSSPKLEETRAHAWCPVCDISNCAMVTPATCNGNIALDLCHCCPICTVQEPATTVQSIQAPVPTNQSEACAKITCPKFQVCMLNIQGLPTCRCPTKFWCMKGERSPVCGENDITYKSKCFLKMTECEIGKNIALQHKGKCFKSEKDKQMKLERERQKEIKKQERQERKRRRRERTEKAKKKKDRKEKKKKQRRQKRKRWTRFEKPKGF